jgi:hypothetical protein
MQGHLAGQGEEDKVSLRPPRDGEGGDGASVAASRGGVISPVDGRGSGELLEHGKREEGSATSHLPYLTSPLPPPLGEPRRGGAASVAGDAENGSGVLGDAI